MLAQLALWLIIMAVVIFFNRREKPPTPRQLEALDRQPAYAPRRNP